MFLVVRIQTLLVYFLLGRYPQIIIETEAFHRTVCMVRGHSNARKDKQEAQEQMQTKKKVA